MTINKNSVILYEGPSVLTGDPIVVIATGFKVKSKNAKTADMIQTTIIRSDMHPVDAVNSGEDKAICGDCTHRLRWYEQATRSVQRRSCYVNLRWVIAIYGAYKRGSYGHATPEHYAIMRKRKVRIGSYGDGAAVPLEVWTPVLPPINTDRTGYTHQWKNYPKLDPGFRSILMASVDTETEEAEALAMGWRIFRVKEKTDKPTGNTFQCPSDPTLPEEDHISCENCGACHGNPTGKPNPRKVSAHIIAHGPTARYFGRPSLPIIH